MDRLTQHNFDYCGEYCASSKDCGFYAGRFPSPCSDRSIYDRLAAYEDTGLEPETLSEILDSVSEWYDAHRDDRLIVLPCKVGDTVWMFSQDKTAVEGWRVYHIGAVAVNHGFLREIRSDDFGKTTFHTREEAEAALGGDGDG